MTDKQELFIAEYLINGFNASEAARTSGYSENTARQIGCELLTKPDIKVAIRKQIESTIGDKNKILAENIIFWVDMRNDEEAGEQARLKASEHLAKYADMFTEHVEVSAPDSVIEMLREKYQNK